MKIIFKSFNKKNVKDVSLVLLSVILIGIGYVNFAKEEVASEEVVAHVANKLGDVELVSSNVVTENIVNEVIVEEVEEPKEDYFFESKLNRRVMYDQSLETYQKIIDNEYISNEQKSIAINEIDKITKEKTSISIAEELIKLKDFEDVVILINDDKINVVVRSSFLSKTQVVQIQNIILKEFQVKAENISISNK